LAESVATLGALPADVVVTVFTADLLIESKMQNINYKLNAITEGIKIK